MPTSPLAFGLSALLLLAASPSLAQETAPVAPEETAAADAPAGGSDTLFMPSADLGAMLFSADELGIGFMVRTIVDYRFRRMNGGFLRINFDTTTAVWSEPATDDLPGLSVPMFLYDLLLGGGMRWGNDEWQVAPSAQAGIVLFNLPSLELDGEVFSLATDTELAGLVRVAVALEWYFDVKAALTFEVLGQRYFGEGEFDRGEGWAGALTAGLTGEL